MNMNNRLQRQLEEVLKIPGNDNCADCHTPAPRWASVNLGIFLCVGCASVHRKLGTHKSRVKSVTLDDWTRDQIQSMKDIGNVRSNSIYNPNELLHPPPTSIGSEERDSEIEKYIRRKYEIGAFRVGGKGNSGMTPTSMNRARERQGLDGLIGGNGSGMRGKGAGRPEWNDLVLTKEVKGRERDLPALPRDDSTPAPFEIVSRVSSEGTSGGSGEASSSTFLAPPRPRPVRSTSSPTTLQVWNNVGNPSGTSQPSLTVSTAESSGMATSSVTSSQTQTPLVDLTGSSSSTRALQLSNPWAHLQSQQISTSSPSPFHNSSPIPMQSQQGAMYGNFGVGGMGFSTSPAPVNVMQTSMGVSPSTPSQPFGQKQDAVNGSRASNGLSPQGSIGFQQMSSIQNQPQGTLQIPINWGAQQQYPTQFDPSTSAPSSLFSMGSSNLEQQSSFTQPMIPQSMIDSNIGYHGAFRGAVSALGSDGAVGGTGVAMGEGMVRFGDGMGMATAIGMGMNGGMGAGANIGYRGIGMGGAGYELSNGHRQGYHTPSQQQQMYGWSQR